ncbi:MAG TPA: hypothetical protein PKM48_04285 [Parvularculaceae bacterium]|nr:hypothetical protein [Parvularculaceae bacterium]
MRYISTRGRSAPIGFRDALLSGLASDGGLYVPDAWPRLAPEEIGRISGLEFRDAATEIVALFAGDELSKSALREMAAAAYAPFDAPQTVPLRRLGEEDFLLELFHGPTLAFKDVAMRLLAQLYDWALKDAVRGKTARRPATLAAPRSPLSPDRPNLKSSCCIRREEFRTCSGG